MNPSEPVYGHLHLSLWGSTAEALNSEEKEKTEPKALLSHACFLGLVPLVSNALNITPRCFHWTRRHAKCTCLSASLSTMVLVAIYCGFLLVPLSPSTRRVQDTQRDELQTTYTLGHSREQNSLMGKVLVYRKENLSVFLDFFCSFSCGLPQLLSLWPM